MKSLYFLVFSFILSSPAISASFKSEQYDKIIIKNAKKNNVPAALIFAVIRQESAFNPEAGSKTRVGNCRRADPATCGGAYGLMQLMPATAKRFGVSPADRRDPSKNIGAGVTYLAWLLKKFNGNVRYALAGYNAGEHNVIKYNGIPPFKETINYVHKVMMNYRMYSGLPPYPEKRPKHNKNTRQAYLKTAKRNRQRVLRNQLLKKQRIQAKQLQAKQLQAKLLQAKKSREKHKKAVADNKRRLNLLPSNRVRSVTVVMRSGYTRYRAVVQ